MLEDLKKRPKNSVESVMFVSNNKTIKNQILTGFISFK